MRIMILGVTGMLGNAMFRVLSANSDRDVFGTARSESAKRYFSDNYAGQIMTGVDVENSDSLMKVFADVKPDVVVNCIGLVKQLADAHDPLLAISINSLLPHRLATLCRASAARLVHFSTDCVFSGSKGSYVESDFSDAYDLYGRSKFLGEVDYPNAITLRTSMIGHELSGHRSLVNWFLAQQASVKGFTRAIFSGLPTVELATLVKDVILPNQDLHGLYHVAAKPINKHDLLQLVAEIYGKTIEIKATDDFVIDRSLNADKFKAATGYVPPEWPALIQRMYQFK